MVSQRTEHLEHSAINLHDVKIGKMHLEGLRLRVGGFEHLCALVSMCHKGF